VSLFRLTFSSTSEDEVVEETISRKKKRVNKIFENADARRIRDQVKLQQAKQEERKKELLAKLAKRGHVNDEVGGRIIVNDAANENELHYITPHIASRIKWHQVEGVRFMWNQIVAGLNEEARQGCLLAHTMGLGKVCNFFDYESNYTRSLALTILADDASYYFTCRHCRSSGFSRSSDIVTDSKEVTKISDPSSLSTDSDR
jgi:SNF2 family DNA or RNA helicase